MGGGTVRCLTFGPGHQPQPPLPDRQNAPPPPSRPQLFDLPLVGLLGFVFGLSLIRLAVFSLKQMRGIDGPWIGLRNYELVLGQPLL
ncbi:MAG: hypothetical protein H7245_24700 [Candidatus Saccharibacteria bacterium]|nr:hypothetical protein [Pseudorhodobacter sp.]